MEQLIECISSRMKLNEFFWSWMRLREASHLFLLQEALYTCSVHDLSQEEFVFPNVNGYSSLMQERWKEPLIQIFCLKTTRSRKLLLALLPVVSDFSHLESGIIQKKWNLYSSHGILHHLQGIICMRKGFKHCKMHLIELWAVISGWKQVKLANICNEHIRAVDDVLNFVNENQFQLCVNPHSSSLVVHTHNDYNQEFILVL